MDDLVALAADTDEGKVCYFLTWGRIQSTVDPAPLEQLVLRVAPRFKTPGEVIAVRLCSSISEAAGAPYFFECYFSFCQKPIPYGKGHKKWRRRTAERMSAGKEISFLGPNV